ncbi:MAG TPA: aminotransferase class V-fold PLP-dependent enzyme, partial [Candidatus Polarisedimenticolaceae bacterium]
MKTLLHDATDRALAFLEELPHRRVAPPVDLAALRATMGGPLPERGIAAGEVLAHLDDAARPGLVASGGPRFFGFVIGGSHPVALASDWLASTWDQNHGFYVLSPPASVAEEVAARWLLELLGLPSRSSVAFVTGAQMANFTALAAARHDVLRRAGWDVETQGLAGSPGIDVVASDESHITVFRALRYLGLGTGNVLRVESDDQGRIVPSSLRSVLDACRRPVVVCAQAGDVNSGAFDPFDEIVPLVRERDGWLHVDGAFGLWAAASPGRRHLVRGVAGADSWSVDAHKWLNVPYDCGIAIVADPEPHRASMSTTTSYLIKSGGAERDPADWTPEFSRRARGIPVYATLRHLGRSGVAELVERCCALTRRFVDRLTASPEVTVLNEVVLNQALLRFRDDDATTREVIARVQQEGTCWLGGTTWKGRAAMRISLVNHLTTEDDVDRSAAAILGCLAEVA